jgi:hypothetical protein
MRSLAKEPREEDMQETDRLRQLLIPLFHMLDARREEATTIVFGLGPSMPINDLGQFDDLDAEVNPETWQHRPATRKAIAEGEIILPERRRLSIPSTWLDTDNIYRPIELKLRIEQASETLQALRDAIADKSFQYSHVIRVAPRKGVRTRARTAITKLNDTTAYLCHVYGQCRSALVKLGAGNEVLNRFQILSKDDIKSSAALLNPNEPGSTRVELSWIWKMGHSENRSTPDGLRECK